MANLNQCNFIGRLGADPEIRYLQNGDMVANLSIAVSEKWTDKANGQQREETEWVRVVAFRKLAEIIAQYVKKGDPIFISGKMKTRKWQDNNGKTATARKSSPNRCKCLAAKQTTTDRHNPRVQQPEQTPLPRKTPRRRMLINLMMTRKAYRFDHVHPLLPG